MIIQSSKARLSRSEILVVTEGLTRRLNRAEECV